MTTDNFKFPGCLMKKSAIFTAALLMSAAASAANPVYTMTSAVVSQKTTVSGCSALTTGGLADVTFYDDYSYLVHRDDPSIPDQTGEWAMIPGTSSYSVYMLPDDQPLSDLFAAFNTAILANCQLKYSAATVSIIQPSVLIKKNVMVVDNADKSAVATFQLKGKQRNTFKGATKVSKYSTLITLKGNVVEAP